MKLGTFNVCGWKSAVRKGLLKWIEDAGIDVLAVQELRTEKITKPLELTDCFCVFNPSKFHGTAIISKKKPISISKKLGHKRFDNEGRFIQLEFKEFIFINVYMPHGRRDKKDLPYKLDAYNFLINYLSKILQNRKPVILVGDFNVAHKEVDLANPKENENNAMFTKKKENR